MAQRRQWQEDLKPKIAEDQPKKKLKINLISEIVYKDGVKVQSIDQKTATSIYSENFLVPRSPELPKHDNINEDYCKAKTLTPTFRKPESYISETNKLFQNILLPCNTELNINNSDINIFAQNADIITTESNLETIDNIALPLNTFTPIENPIDDSNMINSQLASTSLGTYNISVTIDSDDTHNDSVCHAVEVLHEADNHQILTDQKHKGACDKKENYKYNRRCKKKLEFDKSYLDCFDDDDAESLLLNEAFPSEDSNSSWSEDNYSSDDSTSNTVKKKNKKRNEEKKEKKKFILATEKQTTISEMNRKPKNKKKIVKENKDKRSSGMSYTNEKGCDMPPKAMKLNPCVTAKCKRNCGDITEERRFQIFNYYWSLGSLQRQKDWIAKSVLKKEVKTHTTDKGESSRRNCTYEYYINEGEGRRQICQKFLLSTLDVTQRFVLYTLENASEGFSKTDGRKNNGGRNRTSQDVIDYAITFIKLLPLVPSHYCRKDSTRLYLPSEFKNISNLYRIYTRYCNDGNVKTMSFKVLSSWLRENYNIGFHIPKKDKCTICMTQTYDVKNAEDMALYISHLQEKDESYKRFKFHQSLNAVDSSVICASFDMQKVLNTPHGENMALYYTRKIAVYNFTIYESNTQKGYCNLWTEVDAHRGANEIATCLYKYIQEVDQRQNVKKLIFYSDSCFGQNKNKTILSMLRYVLYESDNLEVIQINYLIPGHTFMPVDSMHAIIERAVKKTTIWAPSLWPTVIEMARRNPSPYKVSVLEGKEFISFDTILDESFKKVKKLQISKVCIATFKKSSPNIMFIKRSMLPNADTTEISLGSLNDAEPKVCLYPAKLPITLQKYNNLKKLVDKGIIPKAYANEYLKLKYDKKVKDMLEETDDEDEQ